MCRILSISFRVKIPILVKVKVYMARAVKAYAGRRKILKPVYEAKKYSMMAIKAELIRLPFRAFWSNLTVKCFEPK